MIIDLLSVQGTLQFLRENWKFKMINDRAVLTTCSNTCIDVSS